MLIITPIMVAYAIVLSKYSWPEKKNLNNFWTEAVTHLGLVPLESSAPGFKKYFLSILQNRRKSAIPELNIKIYGNHRFPRPKRACFTLHIDQADGRL